MLGGTGARHHGAFDGGASTYGLLLAMNYLTSRTDVVIRLLAADGDFYIGPLTPTHEETQ
jgi:hypothetical protein